MLRDLRSETKLAREKHERELNKLSKEHSFKVSLFRNYCCTNLGAEQFAYPKVSTMFRSWDKYVLYMNITRMGVIKRTIFPVWIFGLGIFAGSKDLKELEKPPKNVQPSTRNAGQCAQITRLENKQLFVVTHCLSESESVILPLKGQGNS